MFTDWFIWLDFLKENNQNTNFLRLITPIAFGIIESHDCYYYSTYYPYGCGLDGHEVTGNGNGDGFDVSYGNGDGIGYGFNYNNAYVKHYDEEH